LAGASKYKTLFQVESCKRKPSVVVRLNLHQTDFAVTKTLHFEFAFSVTTAKCVKAKDRRSTSFESRTENLFARIFRRVVRCPLALMKELQTITHHL